MVIVFKEDDDDEQFDLSSVGSRQNRKFTLLFSSEVLQEDTLSTWGLELRQYTSSYLSM